MKIITYNVLEGFRGGESLDGIANWLLSQAPDIVALQELNGFTSPDLSQAANRWDHAHAVLLKETGFSTGLTSRLPLTQIERILKPFHHGLLSILAGPLKVFVVHLSPFRFQHRLEEADLILKGIRSAQGQGHDVVVLGDFNSASPLDRDYYEQDGRWRRGQARADEEKPGRENLRDGELDFSVQDRFLKAGLVDAAAKYSLQLSGPRLDFTFPTALKQPSTESEDWGAGRIDFIYTSPGLSKRLLSAHAVRDDELALLSDHYPVVAEFGTE